MKQAMKIGASLLLVVMLLFCTVSCVEKVDASGLWKDATYLSDTTLGKGENTVTVELTVEEQTVIFTIKTDKATLGEALLEHGLVNNNNGLFDTVNGMKADYKVNKSYWAFYVNDEYATFGIFDTKAVTTGEFSYKFVYEISSY